jgi:hypothetical protein
VSKKVMISVLLKATGIWLLIVVAAIINGLLRENLIAPVVGIEAALSISGITLSIVIFLFSLMSVPFIGSSETKTYLCVGIYWGLLTLSFEFLFGHYVVGKSWVEIMQVFNIQKGDLFIVVLFVTAFSPWLSALIRGVGEQKIS